MKPETARQCVPPRFARNVPASRNWPHSLLRSPRLGLFACLWHARLAAEQMSLAGTGTLRQYEHSMLPNRASSHRTTASSVTASASVPRPSSRFALRAGAPLARSAASLVLRIGAPLVLLVQ